MKKGSSIRCLLYYCKFHVQCIAYPLQDVNAHIVPTLLYLADIRPVNNSHICKSFLRHASLLANFPQFIFMF